MYLVIVFGFVDLSLFLYGYSFLLFSFHFSSRNLPKSPLNSPEHPRKYPSNISYRPKRMRLYMLYTDSPGPPEPLPYLVTLKYMQTGGADKAGEKLK